MDRPALSQIAAHALLVVALLGCEAVEEAPAEPLRPVRYERVTRAAEITERTFSGVVEAGLESHLSFRVAGTVQRIHIAVGDRVSSGDLIAELDETDFELKVQQAEASLSLSEAKARRAEADYQRARALYESDGISQSELDAARAAAESASAASDAQKRQLELARSQAGYTRLRAPTTGAIAAVPVDENENVAAGHPVAVLSGSDKPKVHVSVPEGLIGRIEDGAPAVVQLDAVSEKTYEATVIEVGVSPIGIGTTYPVKVRIEDAGPEVRPGMAAEATVRLEPVHELATYYLPPHAVAEDHHSRHVFVVEPGEEGMGRVHRREVAIGALTRYGLEIVEGVEEGDRVVTAGVRHLEDGQEVRFMPEPEG